MPDVKWVATSLVSLVVAIIVIATVAVPVIEEQGAGVTISGKNTGYTARYTDMTDQSFTYVMNADGTAYYTLTYDGSGTQYSSPAASPNLILGDSIILRSGGSSGYFYYNLIDSSLKITTSTVNLNTITIHYDGTDHIWTVESVNRISIGNTGVADFVLMSTTDGPIGLYENKAIRVTMGQPVFAGAFNVSTSGPIRMATFVDGTETDSIFDPFTWTNYDQTAGTADLVAASVAYSVSYDVVGDTQQIGSYSGLTTTYGAVTNSDYSFYAPIDYTSTASGENTGGTNSVLLGIVPVMLFIVAVMMAVRVLQQAR